MSIYTRDFAAMYDRNARAVLERMTPAQLGQDDAIAERVQPAAGSAPVQDECVIVTGVLSDRFVCRRLDGNGQATGNSFEVRAMTLPEGTPVADCSPNFAVNAYMRIRQQTNFIGGTAVSDYFCTDTLQWAEDCT